MDARKKARLGRHGWQLGDAGDFLGLTRDEVTFIETRIALADFVRRTRERADLTQSALAVRLGSSQSRVAKIEAGDKTVSLDLMVRAAIAAGANRAELARAIAPKRRRTG